MTLPQSSPSVPAMIIQARGEPHLSPRGRQSRNQREARLAEALRENLRKRKAQSRGRAAVQETAGPAPDDQGAGGEA